MLISGNSSYQRIAEVRHFSTSAFALVEIKKYQNIIFQKSRLNKGEVRRYGYLLFSKITVCPEFIIEPSIHSKAEGLVANIDTKDVDYLALAIQLGQVLLTRDKPLYSGLRREGFRQIMMFDEFLSGV